MQTKNLEQKIEKINWKEWTPFYGIYQAIIDKKENKPNVFDGDLTTFCASVFYQASLTIAISFGAYSLLK